MSSSVENSLYDIKKSAEDETKLQHSHGPDLRFETASRSMYLDPDTIIVSTYTNYIGFVQNRRIGENNKN